MSSLTWSGAKLGGVLVVLGAVQAGFWFRAAAHLSERVEHAADQLRAQGWHVTTGPIRRTGWPWHVRVAVGPLVVGAGGVTWRAAAAEADMALFGTQTSADALTLTPHDQAMTIGRFDVGVFAQTTVIEIGQGLATLTAAGPAMAQGQAASARLRLSAAGLELDVKHLRLGPVPPVEHLTASARSAGSRGAIEVDDIRAVTGGMRLWGRLTLAVDPAAPPLIEGMMHAEGYAAGLDSLVAAGVLTTPAGVAARAVLDLLAAPSPEGRVDLPVRTENDTLVVAQFPLWRIPWPPKQPDPPNKP